jgi:hypothetical protein
MTTEQLQAIRARLDAATPGPWHLESPFPTRFIMASEDDCVAELIGPWDSGDIKFERRWRGDAALIANAPTDLRALLDEVERLTHNLVQTERHAQIIENSNKLLEAKVNAVGELLSENGCDCDCECAGYSAPHGPDCEPCLACRIDKLLLSGKEL